MEKPKPTVFEELGIQYKEVDGILYPIILPESVKEDKLRPYGIMRAKYLKENDPLTRATMVIHGTLIDHLLTTQEEAEKMEERLINQMKEKQGVNEELKEKDWMTYVQMTENIINSAKEIVRNELIYV